MKIWYVNEDGHARKVERQLTLDGYGIVRLAKFDDVYVVRHRRKPLRWEVSSLNATDAQLTGAKLIYPRPMYTAQDKDTALAWAQMMAAMQGARA